MEFGKDATQQIGEAGVDAEKHAERAQQSDWPRYTLARGLGLR